MNTTPPLSARLAENLAHGSVSHIFPGNSDRIISSAASTHTVPPIHAPAAAGRSPSSQLGMRANSRSVLPRTTAGNIPPQPRAERFYNYLHNHPITNYPMRVYSDLSQLDNPAVNLLLGAPLSRRRTATVVGALSAVVVSSIVTPITATYIKKSEHEKKENIKNILSDEENKLEITKQKKKELENKINNNHNDDQVIYFQSDELESVEAKIKMHESNINYLKTFL